MPATSDPTHDLREFTRSRAPDALARLVEQNVDFVHASALRQLHDPDMAEDVTQAVFIILAKKAASIRPASLAGWLFNTTRYCAANLRRSERRRRRHEREASRGEAYMQNNTGTDPTELIEQLNPMLDDVLAKLRPTDREVVLLRYLQGREFDEISQTLHVSESAARKRLNRAIERLREQFAARGVSVATLILGAALAAAPRKAPAHVITSATSAASGHAATGATSTKLAAKMLHAMTWAKAKIAAMVILGAAVTGTGATMIVMSVKATATAPSSQPAAQANGESQPSAATTQQSAQTSPSDLPIEAKTKDGWTLEFLGISSEQRAGGQWSPNGEPLSGDAIKIIERIRPEIKLGMPQPLIGDAAKQQKRYRLFVRATHSGGQRIPTLTLQASKSLESSWVWVTLGNIINRKDGNLFTGDIMLEAVVGWPAELKTANVQIGIVSQEDWKTLATNPNPAATPDDSAQIERGDFPPIRFMPITRSSNGIKIEVQQLLQPDLGWRPYRILGHGPNGDIIGKMRSETIGGPHQKYMVMEYVLPNKDADLVSLEYQAQQFVWIEFQNVAC